MNEHTCRFCRFSRNSTSTLYLIETKIKTPDCITPHRTFPKQTTQNRKCLSSRRSRRRDSPLYRSEVKWRQYRFQKEASRTNKTERNKEKNNHPFHAIFNSFPSVFRFSNNNLEKRVNKHFLLGVPAGLSRKSRNLLWNVLHGAKSKMFKETMEIGSCFFVSCRQANVAPVHFPIRLTRCCSCEGLVMCLFWTTFRLA